jgi:hypothetical protein
MYMYSMYWKRQINRKSGNCHLNHNILFPSCLLKNVDSVQRRKIRVIEGNANEMSASKKIDL